MVFISVYDSKACFYSKPMLFRNKFEALRSISDEANEPKSQLHIHSSDYTVFELGTWDEVTGKIHMHDVLLNLGLVTHLKKPDNVTDIRKTN